MRAIRVHAFGGPEALTLDEVELPPPGPGQVRVRVMACGVNPVDAYIRSGTYNTRPPLPYTPGMDGAGVIDAVGEDVTRWQPGQRVYTANARTGTYAEYALCDADEVMSLPAAVSFAQGAATWVAYATSYRALFQIGRARACERVLIHGASGSVGTAAVQWATARGIQVVGTAGSAEGLSLVEAQGAAHAVNHREEGYRDQLMELTGGEGFDVIVEMAAHINLDHDLDLVRERGRVLVVGCREPLTINPRKMMGKESSVHGVMLFGMTPSERAEATSAIEAGLTRGYLRPVIQQVLPLAQAARAHELVMRDGARGKIILEPNHEELS